MKSRYDSIRGRIKQKPTWWDEHGVPGYGEFTPHDVNDIYAKEIAECVIKCQNCGRMFSVVMTTPMWEFSNTLSRRILNGMLGYGDPPNDDCCPFGSTMSSDMMLVEKFWVKGEDNTGWIRKPEFEVSFDGGDI